MQMIAEAKERTYFSNRNGRSWFDVPLQMQIFHYRKEQTERSPGNSAFAKHKDNQQSER